MRKSMTVALLLFAMLALILVLVFSYVCRSYVIYIESPDISFDRISIHTGEELEIVHAYETDRYVVFVIGAVKEGLPEVHVSFSSSEDESRHLDYDYQFSVNHALMLYPQRLDMGFRYWQLIPAGAAVYFLIMGIWFFMVFRRQWKTNVFDYHVMFNCALMLMCFAFTMLFTAAIILLVTRFTTLSAAAGLPVIGAFAVILMLLTLPFVLVFSLAVGVSNIALIRREGFRKVNLFGIVIGAAVSLSILLAGSTAASYFFRFEYSPVAATVFNIAALVILFFEFMLASASICAFGCQRKQARPDRDYIVILGCGIRPDGSLYPLLRGRVDKALEAYEREYEQTGRHPVLVPSGGKGADEPVSEAEAMQKYLLEQGVCPGDILPENKSATTLENMRFSKRLIEANGGSTDKVAFATTNYHVFRSGIYASAVGMKAQGLGAKAKWYFWPNAFLREFIGLVYAYRKTELLMGIFAACIVSVIANLQGILMLLS